MNGYAHLICDFAADAPGLLRCKRCGQSVTHGDPSRPPRFACRKQPAQAPKPKQTAATFSPTPPEALPCVHRGAKLRDEKCRRESCAGGVLFDVLACSEFGECSIDHRAVKGLHVCKTCKSRQPPAADPAAQTEAPKPPRYTTRSPAPVAVVIPCRNYGRYLAEALDSVLAQTVRPAEIVVIDNGSTDNTAKVTARYAAQGVRLEQCKAVGPHQARGAGFRATSAEWLCFLDADDTLAPNYLESALATIRPGVGVVYSPLVKFGDEIGPVDLPTGDLFAQNFIHAGSLVRRIALESARVFQTELPALTLEDWFTWRKLAADGWKAVPQTAAYNYRRHPDGRSLDIAKAPYFVQRAIELDEVTIAVPLSGRLAAWQNLSAWLERQTWPRAQTRVLLVDTSHDDYFGGLVRRWLANARFSAVQYIALDVGDPGLAEADRHQNAIYRAVQAAMPRIYNRVRSEVTTPWVLIVEHDITPPDNVAARLLQSFDARTVSVSGAYRSRYDVQNFIAWDKTGTPYTEPGTGVIECGGNGFGCVMLRTSTLRSTVLHHGGQRGDFDPNFYRDLPAGAVAKLDWSVLCAHG